MSTIYLKGYITDASGVQREVLITVPDQATGLGAVPALSQIPAGGMYVLGGSNGVPPGTAGASYAWTAVNVPGFYYYATLDHIVPYTMTLDGIGTRFTTDGTGNDHTIAALGTPGLNSWGLLLLIEMQSRVHASDRILVTTTDIVNTDGSTPASITLDATGEYVLLRADAGAGKWRVVDATAGVLSPEVITATPTQRLTGTLTADGTVSIPAGWFIQDIIFRNTTANAVTGGIRVGTTDTGTEVITAQAVGANGLLRVVNSALTKSVFSASVATTLYVQTVTNWNSASVNYTITLAKFT